MAKDPAFLFYSSDWLTGTAMLTHEEKGIYIDLMCLQHQHGGIIQKQFFNAMVGERKQIRRKFTENESGFINLRLLEVMTLRNRKSSNISVAVKEVWRKRMESHTESHTESNMRLVNENENENITNTNSSIIKEKKQKIEIEIYRKFDHLTISVEDFDKLVKDGFTKLEIDSTLDAIENYSKNKNYKNLYLTCKKWLQKNKPAIPEPTQGLAKRNQPAKF